MLGLFDGPSCRVSFFFVFPFFRPWKQQFLFLVSFTKETTESRTMISFSSEIVTNDDTRNANDDPSSALAEKRGWAGIFYKIKTRRTRKNSNNFCFFFWSSKLSKVSFAPYIHIFFFFLGFWKSVVYAHTRIDRTLADFWYNEKRLLAFVNNADIFFFQYTVPLAHLFLISEFVLEISLKQKFFFFPRQFPSTRPSTFSELWSLVSRLLSLTSLIPIDSSSFFFFFF